VSERHLALAVIRQAMDDACEVRVVDRRGAPFPAAEPDPVEGARGAGSPSLDAWAFLTDMTGEWAQSRHDWADAAGVLPAAVRAEAIRRGPNRTVRMLLARRRAAE
jgi:hypothetical protein